MKRTRLKNFLLIAILIAATGVAMAYSSNKIGVLRSNWIPGHSGHVPGDDGGGGCLEDCHGPL